jgi:hypothetical protein
LPVKVSIVVVIVTTTAIVFATWFALTVPGFLWTSTVVVVVPDLTIPIVEISLVKVAHFKFTEIVERF